MSQPETTEVTHFFTEEKFQLLKQCRQDILKATDVSPSIRKIINELINSDNLESIKSKFINLWRNQA